MNKTEISNLKRHFSDFSNPVLRNFSMYRSCTGAPGVKYINEKVKPNTVLDVGCGANKFKEHIPGLTGIDLLEYRDFGHPTGPDIVDNVRNFYLKEHPKFDMIYCVGTFNFGTMEDMYMNFDIFTKMAPRIFGHARPGGPGDDKRAKKAGYPYYQWTFDEVHFWAKEFNMDVINIEAEHTDVSMMTDEHLQMYYDGVTSNIEKKPGYLQLGVKAPEDAVVTDPRCDPLKISGNVQEVVVNEWNRRFNKDEYVEGETRVRPRMHFEMAR